MEETTPTPAGSRKLYWAGWVLSVLPALLLLMSGTMKLRNTPELEQGFEHMGWPANLAIALGIVELACTLLYLFPPTAMLGAILVTGYMGGAIATHVRLGEPFFVQSILPIVVWIGLFLREPRLWVLLPIRR